MAGGIEEKAFALPSDPEARTGRLNQLIAEGWTTVSVSGDTAVMRRAAQASEGQNSSPSGRRTLLD